MEIENRAEVIRENDKRNGIQINDLQNHEINGFIDDFEEKNIENKITVEEKKIETQTTNKVYAHARKTGNKIQADNKTIAEEKKITNTVLPEDRVENEICGANAYFGGIEGGATATHMVIIDSSRNIISEAKTSATNPWLMGFDNSAKLLIDLIAKAQKKLPHEAKLEAIGMSLSGAGQEESRTKLKNALQKAGADISKIYIEEDVLAPVYTISDKGGVNMICGTGSNCVVYNPNGTQMKVGGWGHILGDEASGYWIAHRAIKTLIDERDGFIELNYDTTSMKEIILKYFNIKDLDEILAYVYTNFSKERIAGLAKEIADLACNRNDELAKDLFKQTGYQIGRHIVALRKHIDEALIPCGCLTIICTGSVFKSWKLMKVGFMKAVDPTITKTEKKCLLRLPGIKTIKLIRLTANASIGAAVWASKHMQWKINESTKNDFEVIDIITAAR